MQADHIPFPSRVKGCCGSLTVQTISQGTPHLPGPGRVRGAAGGGGGSGGLNYPPGDLDSGTAAQSGLKDGKTVPPRPSSLTFLHRSYRRRGERVAERRDR